MTPTTADILAGNARVIAGLAGDEQGPDFAAARLGVVAMLSLLAAQEAATGAAVRVAENADIRAVLGDEGGDEGQDRDLTIAALDVVNADLRRRLIAVHERTPNDAAILALYRRIAAGRLLELG